MKTKIEYEFLLDPRNASNDLAFLYNAIGTIRVLMTKQDFENFRKNLLEKGIRIHSIKARKVFGWGSVA